MAYAAVTSLKETLHLHFLQSQPRLPLQHNQQILNSLHENLGFLQEFLEKSEIGDDNLAMKDLEAEMRDVAFKAEERIEMELSSLYLAKGWTKHIRIKACLLRLDGILKQAVKQTDYLKKKFIKIQSKHQFPKGPSILGRMRQRGLLLGSTSSQPADPQRQNITVSKFSKSASKFDSRMVGCDKEFKMILDKLTQQSAEKLQVVSIVGMGGIGKTTLAEKVYKDPSITSHFYKQAWVTVSQVYNVEQMLQCLIGCVNAASRDELHEQSNELHEQRQRNAKENLRRLLMGNRYLIVMDDIWSTTAWDSVQGCFPDDNNGSRILLTSRLREVAEYASSGNSTINMPFLDANKSWNLFCNVFGQTKFLSVFEQIGRDIVKKCNGLPLAITLVASLLSKTEAAVEKWKNVAENVSRYVIGDSNDACSRILYLSYNQLPHHLKACFLYFGVFPEDYEIHVKKLVRLWAAEGFLKTVDHRNMEEVAMECLQDLIDRSLVLVGKQSCNGKIKTIRMHDLLRDLCLREARYENLLNVIGNDYHGAVAGLVKLLFYKRKSQHLFPKPCPWISIKPGCYRIQMRSMCFDKLHSLHSVNHVDFSKKLLCHFKLLRVVDVKLELWNFKDMMVYMANLVHLRYLALSLHNTSFFELKLFEHWNMQSFIVRTSSVILCSREASRIWKMPLLKNFYVDTIPFTLEASEVVHKNIESISWLRPKCCTEDLFTRIPNLKKLGIQGDKYEHESSDGFHNFVHLEQLEKLSIKECYLKLPYSGIPWATGFLPNLKKLKFFWTNFSWSDMVVIGMLPNLEVLKLLHACQGSTEWEPCEGGFRQLKRLVIESHNLRDWNAMGDHFPVLEHLELNYCNLLREIPIAFADINTLKLIQLKCCWDSVLTSAKLIQDEQRSYGNEALLVRSIYTRKNAQPRE